MNKFMRVLATIGAGLGKTPQLVPVPVKFEPRGEITVLPTSSLFKSNEEAGQNKLMELFVVNLRGCS